MKYASMGILLLAVAASACGGDDSEVEPEPRDPTTVVKPDTQNAVDDDDDEETGERFDVQLVYAPTVAFPTSGRGGILVERKVLRLHADGSYERCGEVGATNGTGGRTNASSTTERGSYQFVEPNLILTDASGNRRSLRFFYSSEEKAAVIGGVLWSATKPSVGPLVCDALAP